jgi:hypothetical protein
MERPVWEKNILAYYKNLLITAKKGFIALSHGPTFASKRLSGRLPASLEIELTGLKMFERVKRLKMY